MEGHGGHPPYGAAQGRMRMSRTQRYELAMKPSMPRAKGALDDSLHRAVNRRILDYTGPLLREQMLAEAGEDGGTDPVMQPVPVGALDLMPPASYINSPATNLNTKFVHVSTNKIRCPVNALVWTPGGRRLLTGCHSGEFTLWNGMCFNFETIIQAHQNPVRCLDWANSENWLVSGDDSGTIQYWTTTLNKAKQIPVAHREAVRGLSFSPTDLKFASCSDDTTVKIWDFTEGKVEHQLMGHGGDVKDVDWHPKMSLIASCSKDSMLKLWDPRAGKTLTNLHGHKNTVSCLKWNKNGNWILSGGRDQCLKLFDIRVMKEIQTYRGQNRDITSLCWHPIHEDLFVSGGYDGSVLYWLVPGASPQSEIRNAHETAVRGMAWHPVGHVLSTCSHDNSTKFWGRNRPGDTYREKQRFDGEDMPMRTPGLNVPQSLSSSKSGVIPGLGPIESGGYEPSPRGGHDKRPRDRFLDTDRNKRGRYDNYDQRQPGNYQSGGGRGGGDFPPGRGPMPPNNRNRYNTDRHGYR